MRSFLALSFCFLAGSPLGAVTPAVTPPTPAPSTPPPAAAPGPTKPATAPKDDAGPSKPAAEKPKDASVKPPPDDAYRQMELLTRAMETIRQSYVNESQITYEALVEGALEGMLRKLDPHCEYMGKSLFEDLRREQADESEGVGISVALREGTLTIVSVREDGPAAHAGILAGDQMVRINDVLTDSVGVAEAIQLLSGKAGETLKLTIRRPGTKQFLEFHLIRETLSETSVHDAMLFTPKLAGEYKIGYARVSEFTQATAHDLSDALDELEKQGMQAFVLDMRNNPGGLLDSAVAVCGEFLPEGTVVVTTEGRISSQNPPPYRTPSREGKKQRRYPMAVIVNHASASAAEITAGALQDLKRAIVVGTTSFGKGSVQSIIPMKNGAAMRLTIAKYYTPSHRTIHEHGVEPNIVSVLSTEEEIRVAKWRVNHSTGEAAAIEIANLGDKQIERAVDALKGALVFESFKPREEAPKPAPVKAPPPNVPKALPMPVTPAPATPAKTE
ncbi:MAG: S41 family peptidase [Verrucomicrobiota bacterium]